MKKRILLTATLTQLDFVRAQVRVGLKVCMNASSLKSTPANSDLETKIGFNAGILAHIHTSNPQWAVQPELYYSLEGAKSKSNNDAKLNLDYLNLPVLLQYMFDNGFRIEAGPQLGFLVSAKSKLNSTSVDVKDNYKTASFSIPAGVGYLTSSGLGFDARYNF